MNLGQAAAVCLYELSRKELTIEGAVRPQSTLRGEEVNSSKLKVERMKNPRSSEGEIGKVKLENGNSKSKDAKQFAEMETVERITKTWLEALQRSGYVGARARSTAEQKLRSMLRRFTMEEGDAEVVLGMIKKIVGKLQKE
jgi:tRNA C32,U32 (ribose-2'-O)-methylase TrmJ